MNSQCVLTMPEPKSCGLCVPRIEPHRLVPYKPLLDKAIEKAEFKPEASIIYQRLQVPADKQVKLDLNPGFDFDWQTEMSAAQPVAPVAVKSTESAVHFIYIGNYR